MITREYIRSDPLSIISRSGLIYKAMGASRPTKSKDVISNHPTRLPTGLLPSHVRRPTNRWVASTLAAGTF